MYLSRPILLPRNTRSGGGEDPFADLAVGGRRATCPQNRKRQQRLKPRGLAGDGVLGSPGPPPLSKCGHPELQLPEGFAADSHPPSEPRPLASEAGSLSRCTNVWSAASSSPPEEPRKGVEKRSPAEFYSITGHVRKKDDVADVPGDFLLWLSWLMLCCDHALERCGY